MSRRQIDKWIKKLLFNYGLSWFIATTGAAGSTIIAAANLKAGFTFAILMGLGMGLVSGATTLITVWFNDPDLKGTQITLRQDVKEVVPIADPNAVTITRPR